MTNVRNVPKLRFPEFRDAGEWETDLLGSNKVSKFISERVALEQLNQDTYVSTENLLPDYAGVTRASKLPPSGSFTRYKKGDVLVSNIRPYLKKVWSADKEGASSNDVVVIRSGEKATSIFLTFILKNDLFINYVMTGAKGVKMPRGDISSMKEYPVAFPTGDEQQKIADCLASLDELIALEAQKLDTLKTHKKGLMQQLFPAEGETLPKLRFPEFRDAGEWDIKTLSELAENLDNRRIPVTESDRVKGAIPYYGASGIVDYIHDFIFDEELLCISEDGANLVARSTPIAFSISGKTWVNNHAHVLKFERRCVQKIVEDYLNSISLEDYLTGMAQPKLNRAMLDTIPVPIPRDECEQQKVADCLSSLDDLIDAQSQKLDALKVHKKGLMQQLFPSMEAEV
ncbi:restriction endonuclease subunit S [Candidatus Contendibacter odensensis]|uniref:Restriction modification system DNA specificity domain n=1 Tax=Candidatus Contendobacter odensis Run_B_J11 TaxID=1400861 RepID=A0A7U7J293_9GAMM|nr:restriction endonuclease subunit S [Candidatus Contendobacter odensis]CDH43900.1 Restriction modification system DNA specificity domain [Candidatus Contendobacter odensis Run_B_J11]